MRTSGEPPNLNALLAKKIQYFLSDSQSSPKFPIEEYKFPKVPHFLILSIYFYSKHSEWKASKLMLRGQPITAAMLVSL